MSKNFKKISSSVDAFSCSAMVEDFRLFPWVPWRQMLKEHVGTEAKSSQKRGAMGLFLIYSLSLCAPSPIDLASGTVAVVRFFRWWSQEGGELRLLYHGWTGSWWKASLFFFSFFFPILWSLFFSPSWRWTEKNTHQFWCLARASMPECSPKSFVSQTFGVSMVFLFKRGGWWNWWIRLLPGEGTTSRSTLSASSKCKSS